MIRYTPHMSHTNRKSNAKRKARQGKAYKEKSQNRKIYRVGRKSQALKATNGLKGGLEGQEDITL